MVQSRHLGADGLPVGPVGLGARGLLQLALLVVLGAHPAGGAGALGAGLAVLAEAGGALRRENVRLGVRSGGKGEQKRAAATSGGGGVSHAQGLRATHPFAGLVVVEAIVAMFHGAGLAVFRVGNQAQPHLALPR